MSNKVQVGLAGIWFRSFWGFEPSQYQDRIRRLEPIVAALGARLTALPEAFEDARGAEAAARQLQEQADLVILDVATFPEGKAAGAFFDGISKPLMLWSRGETIFGEHIGHNSFCGANFLKGNLALRQRRCRCLYGEPNGEDFRRRLATAVRLIAAAKGLSGARIGLIGGGIVPKFHDLDIRPEDLTRLAERYGIEFVGVTLEDLLAAAEALTPKQVQAGSAELTKTFRRIAVAKDALEKQARLIGAVRMLAERDGLAATAVRCWPELQKLYNAWPCAAISMLNELGLPTACEGDPAGALDMLLAARLSGAPATLLDIVDWDETRNALAIWHCGPSAVSWADSEAGLVPHNVDGKGPDGRPTAGLPAVVNMDFAPSPVTILRTLGALDEEFVVEGQILPCTDRRICGCCGYLGEPKEYGRARDVSCIRDEIFTRSLPHHFAAMRGHVFS